MPLLPVPIEAIICLKIDFHKLGDRLELDQDLIKHGKGFTLKWLSSLFCSSIVDTCLLYWNPEGSLPYTENWRQLSFCLKMSLYLLFDVILVF